MARANLHEVVITALVVKDPFDPSTPLRAGAAQGKGKFLLERRALTKKRFPGKWTVPGGKLEPSDYVTLPKDTEHYWYKASAPQALPAGRQGGAVLK